MKRILIYFGLIIIVSISLMIIKDKNLRYNIFITWEFYATEFQNFFRRTTTNPSKRKVIDYEARRKAAIEEAEEKTKGKSVSELIEALKDSDTLVRKYALSELRKKGGDAKNVIDAFILALGVKPESIKIDAADALGNIGPAASRAVPDLINLLQSEYSTPTVRSAVRGALAKIGTKKANEALEYIILYEFLFFNEMKEEDRGYLLKKAGSPYIDTSKNYYSLGLTDHEKGNYERARMLFTLAIKITPKDPLPYYYRALTSVKIKNQKWHDPQLFGSPPLSYHALYNLHQAFELDNKMKKRALNDPNFSHLRDTLLFQTLDGSINLKSDKDIKKILTSRYWRGNNDCGGGLWSDGLLFDASGVVTAGCGNPTWEHVDFKIAKNFTVSKSNISLIEPAGEMKSLHFYFDGVEGHVKEVTPNSSKPRIWNEITGYYGSP